VSKDIVSGFAIAVAPLNEQRRIVSKIEALESHRDAAQEALEAIPPLLEKFRQSVLAAAFRGDLTREWRAQNPDVEPASVLLERIRAERKARFIEDAAETARAKAEAKARDAGKPWTESDDQKALEQHRAKAEKKYKEPEPVDTTDLPELPEGWCWATIEEIANVGTGATPKRGDDRFWANGSIPWVTSSVASLGVVTEPSDFVTEAALAETNISLYPAGTLVVAMYGEGKTRGQCAELAFSTTTNQALAALVTHGTAYKLRGWLKLFMEFNYEKTRLQASGGVQPNLNLSIVKAIALPLAPAEEQRPILLRISKFFSAEEEVRRVVQEQRLDSQALSQSILAKAFRGELVPQDPNDEPAAVLLERIREERAAAAPAKKKRKSKK